MKNISKHTYFIVQSGIIAALYAGLTYLSGLLMLSYGAVQFRFSEALTILPIFTPAAIPGLAIGCFLGNLGSPFGIVDIVCGTLATLLAALCSRAVRNVKIKGFPVLAPLMPVVFNALIIGAEIASFSAKGTRWTVFLISALEVGLGEIVVCYIFGFLLFKAFESSNLEKMLK
ncbi:MAG: QueT transporter family protein [Oscillospiraceae bacterium]